MLGLWGMRAVHSARDCAPIATENPSLVLMQGLRAADVVEGSAYDAIPDHVAAIPRDGDRVDRAVTGTVKPEPGLPVRCSA